MNLSVSDFKAWLECPHKQAWKTKLGRWLPPTGALHIGTAFHSAMELFWQNKPIEGLTRAGILQSLEPKDAKAVEKLLDKLPELAYLRDELGEVQTERAFSAPLFEGPISLGTQLVGRLDGLAQHRTTGQWWSVQYKTIASGKAVDMEARRVANSFHELAYDWLCAQHGIELAGTLAIVAIKLSDKDTAAGRFPFLVSWEERDRTQSGVRMETLLTKLRECAEDLASEPNENSHFRNTESCMGKFGNSPCPLFASCFQGADIEHYADVNFTFKLEDRYADIANGGSE